MKVEELKQMRESVKRAMTEAFNAMLQTSSDEDIKKYKNMNEQLKELDAQIEMVESKGLVPEKKPVELTETQRFVKKFIEAVSTSGNFSQGLPKEMAAEVVKKMDEYAALRGVCRVYNASSDLAITVESGLPTVAYATEGGAIGVSDPSTAPVILGALKLACIVKINRELVNDVTFDIVNYVEDTLARAFALKEDNEILFGSGNNEIEGVTSKSGINSKTCASTTTVTWAELKACLTALGPYRQGASTCLVMSQKIADDIHDFKDGSGNYLFPQNEELKRIMGYPVKISQAMPTPAATKHLVVAGNFDYYALGIREGFDLTVLNELFAANDQVGVKAVAREDGKVLQPKAFSVLVAHA